MGDVMVVFKLYPEEAGDSEKIVEGVKGLSFDPAKVVDIKREPIAFGLEVVRVGVRMPDKTEGLMDKVEEALKGLDRVGEVETESATLL